MFQLSHLSSLEEYFLPMTQRGNHKVYSYRISAYHPEMETFLGKYLLVAQQKGLVQEQRLPNPSPAQLNYYQEILGGDFTLSLPFLEQSLRRWLPRLHPHQGEIIASAIFHTLEELGQQGKNLNILKNIYVKFLCWMYYRLEPVLRQLGKEDIPKIFYQGAVSDYELRLFSVLLKAGCDLVFLQLEGEQQYASLDPENRCSLPFLSPSLIPFPTGFSIAYLREKQTQNNKLARLYQNIGTLPFQVHTNQWQQNKLLEDILIPPQQRGEADQSYPLYGMILGVQDKVEYPTTLYQTYLSLTQSGRDVLLLQGLPVPSPDEIQKIQKGQYQETFHLLQDMSKNISFPEKPPLEKRMKKAFLDLLLGSQEFLSQPIHRQINQCVYLLVWLQRYQHSLFQHWQTGDISCCFFLKDDTALPKYGTLFFRLCANLPVDLLILSPSNTEAPWEDPLLLMESYADTLVLSQFPKENPQVGTVAYHAQQEITEILQQESGIYSQRQFQKAKAITLKTMYEEISILWRQDCQYRPNFFSTGEEVHIPVIFGKISGVPQGNVPAYWTNLRELLGADTILIPQAPWYFSKQSLPFLDVVTGLYDSTGLHREKIKAQSHYSYGFFREEVQEHILDTIALFLSLSPLKSMTQQGTSHLVVALGLSLPLDLLRLIQTFDFTKVPPKICYIQAKEQMPTIEDAIQLALLHLLGFDVLVFVPTGYLSLEQYYQIPLMEEHQVGTYLYDLEVPSLEPMKKGFLQQTASKLFQRKKS